MLKYCSKIICESKKSVNKNNIKFNKSKHWFTFYLNKSELVTYDKAIPNEMRDYWKQTEVKKGL